MKQAGVKKCVMLTGDRKEAAESVAAQLGIDEVYAELLPGDKVVKVEKLLEIRGTKKSLLLPETVLMMLRCLQEQILGLPWGAWDLMRP